MSKQYGSERSSLGALLLGLCLLGCGEILGIETLESNASQVAPVGGDGESSDAGDGPGGGGTMAGSEADMDGPGRAGAESDSPGGDATAGVEDDGDGPGGPGEADEQPAERPSEPGDKPGADGPPPDMEGMEETDAGTDRPATGPVSGKIIDVWGHAVPDAVVTVGEETVLSEADGSFSMDDVGAVYDVELILRVRSFGNMVVNAWIFEGLTRRDPTLEVFRGRPELGSTLNIEVTYAGFDESNSLPDDQTLLVGFGSPDGAFDVEMSGPRLSYLSGSWFGADATAGTTHALLWEHDEDLPVRYLAYDSVPTAMNVNQPGEVTLDMEGDEPKVESISGTLGATDVAGRSLAVYARFDSNAVLPLLDDSRVAETFSYPVPSLPGAALTVVGTAGQVFFGEPESTAYLDNVVPGQAGLELDFRRPPAPISPQPGTDDATKDQEFTWRNESPVSLFRIELDRYYETLYIVTAENSTRLRTLRGDGFEIQPGEPASWRVEHHGDYASVDEATGKDGFLSPLAAGEPRGRRRASGFLTRSVSYGVTVATD